MLVLIEWAELKMKVREIYSQEPSFQYVNLWQRILQQSEQAPSLRNVLVLVEIVLVIPVQTATIERAFSLVKRVKSDCHKRLSPTTLSQLMIIKLDGPQLNKFDCQLAVARWWKVGTRGRRSGSTTYGPHQHDIDSSSTASDSD